MQCCPLTHAVHTFIAPGNERRERTLRGTLYRFATATAARLGWHRLEQLLDAIPDSNDDFMIF
jgi:hypothetical protein